MESNLTYVLYFSGLVQQATRNLVVEDQSKKQATHFPWNKNKEAVALRIGKNQPFKYHGNLRVPTPPNATFTPKK